MNATSMTDISQSGAILTTEGRKKAEEELKKLKTETRKEVSEKIYAAKELGDLSENAEYNAAKEEQAFIEARILELEHLLKYAEDVHETEGDEVGIGNEVTVQDANGSERAYSLVGFNEANPSEGKISNESPMGHALMGAKINETISYDTPGGERTLTIISIS